MKKRKILFILSALFLIYPAMHGQKSVERLFDEFSKEKGVEHVKLGKLMATLFTKGMSLNRIDIWSFDECTPSVIERLNHTIVSLKDENYETIVSVNEENERTKILVKQKGNIIHEIVVATTGDESAIVRIKGKIKPSDIEKVINNNKPNK